MFTNLTQTARLLRASQHSIIWIDSLPNVYAVAITTIPLIPGREPKPCAMADGGSTKPNPSQAVSPVTPIAMSGSSTPLLTGKPGSKMSMEALWKSDSRQHMPSNWDEVDLLQEALQPSIRSFSRITSRSPPNVMDSPWSSYAMQLDILQRESDRCWKADRRPGAPPKLAALNPWTGGILMVYEASFHTTEDMTEEFVHPRVKHDRSRSCSHREGSPSWQQDKYISNTQAHFQKFLESADARKAKLSRLEIQAVEGNGYRDSSEAITTMLDNIVKRDPERYLAWLTTMGYVYFKMSDHNPFNLGWEDWCTWKAPRSFELCCKPACPVRRPPCGPGAIDRTKYGPAGNRPTITLKDAKKGNERAMEFRGTANGTEVSQKETAEYHMLSSEATSREAAAHYSAIRGEDVWLSHPMDSLEEACNDLSYQREAELEAMFRCRR